MAPVSERRSVGGNQSWPTRRDRRFKCTGRLPNGDERRIFRVRDAGQEVDAVESIDRHHLPGLDARALFFRPADRWELGSEILEASRTNLWHRDFEINRCRDNAIADATELVPGLDPSSRPRFRRRRSARLHLHRRVDEPITEIREPIADQFDLLLDLAGVEDGGRSDFSLDRSNRRVCQSDGVPLTARLVKLFEAFEADHRLRMPKAECLVPDFVGAAKHRLRFVERATGPEQTAQATQVRCLVGMRFTERIASDVEGLSQ